MKNVKLNDEFKLALLESTRGDRFDVEGTLEKRLEKFMKFNSVVPEIGDVIGDYDITETDDQKYTDANYKVAKVMWVMGGKEISIEITLVKEQY